MVFKTKDLILKNKSALFLLIIVGASLVFPSPAAAGISDAIGNFIAHILEQGIQALAGILKIELWILPIIAQYNDFIREPGVIKGWIALRDLGNMFFIVILLIIAFSTILKIQNYGYRQLLKRFLIIAILVNFSRTIVGILIDFSQVIMLTFVNAIKELAAGNIMVALGLGNIMQSGLGIANEDQGFSLVPALFLGLIMILITVVVVMVIIAVLVMRIVTLWVLAVLSPIAFVAYTFPKTEKYFNEWTEELGKNLFAGPALAFFLWLAFTITGEGDVNEHFPGGQSSNYGSGSNQASGEFTRAAEPGNVINFIIGIAILIAGLQMTQRSGVAGAGLAGSAANYIKSAPGKLGRRAQRAGMGLAKGAGGLAGAGVKGAGRLAWSGTSGEGMGKAALSRLRGLAGGGVSLVGGNSWVGRIGQRMQGAEQARRKRKQEKSEEGAKDVRDRVAYAEGKGGHTGAAMLGKEMMASGQVMDAGQAVAAANAADYLSDDEFGASMKKEYGAGHNTGSVDESVASVNNSVNKNGFSDTFRQMKISINADGTLASNGDVGAMRAFLAGSEEDREKTISSMDDDTRGRFMEGLAAYGEHHMADPTDTGLDTAGEYVVGSEFNTIRESMVRHGNQEQVSRAMTDNLQAPTGTALSDAHLDSVAGRATPEMRVRNLVELDHASPEFARLAANMNAAQTTQFLGDKNTTDEQIRALVASQLRSGVNFNTLKGNDDAKKAMAHPTVKPLIQESFQVQITEAMAAGETREAAEGRLGRQNLGDADKVFVDHTGAMSPHKLAKFVATLTADQANQVGRKNLQAISGMLKLHASSELLAAIEKKVGIKF